MSAYTDAVLALPTLLGYWPLNEASGTTATDLKGTIGNGTYTGTGVTYGQPSLLLGDLGNTSVLLDGTNGRITRASEAALDLTAGFCLMVWVQPTDTATDRALMAKPNFNYNLFYRSPGIFSTEGPATAGSPNYTAVANNTYMVVGGYDGSNVTTTVNGVLTKSTAHTGSVSTSATSLEIGAWANTQKFKGYMQHAALLSSPPNLATIQNLYTLGAGPTAVDGANVYTFTTVVLPENADRDRAIFSNCGDRAIDITLGGTATVGSGVRLQVGSEPFVLEGYTGPVSAIFDGFLGYEPLGIEEI